MVAMQRVDGVVQHYAWGDPTFIPHLLGVEPDGRPWAELWLGTHANGAARLADGTPLEDVSGPLPYLLKVLAAVGPLSLQTHPNAEQATIGFEAGRYHDASAKPELLCALTPFHALCGIRPVQATLDLFDELGIHELAAVVRSDGPGAALDGLYRGEIDPRPAVEACQRTSSTSIEAAWVRILEDMYPGDASVAVTLLLNLVVLEPGECIRLDAGNLHAYLRGAGVELMGNSDNVVRGGLTVKHVDVDDLLQVVDRTPLTHPTLPVDDRYALPAAGVALLRLEPGRNHRACGHELAVTLEGGCWYLAPGDEMTATSTTFVVVPHP